MPLRDLSLTLTPVRDLIDRFICWAIERTQEPVRVAGLTFYDARYHEEPRALERLRAATGYLDRGDAGFRELVYRELRMVVATKYSQGVYPAPRAYLTRFEKWERASPLFLASRLVWTAEYIRLSRTGCLSGPELICYCTRKQVAFIEGSGEHPDWLDSLKRHAA